MMVSSAPAPKSDAAADAMDGLSDSDLETLLRNFNELSAEEQHSLIAYLKKLEVREPQRVERLRRFVSAAASNAQPAPEPTSSKTVTVESDDDDYTVEDVSFLVTVCLTAVRDGNDHMLVNLKICFQGE